MTRIEMSRTHKMATAAVVGMEAYCRRTMPRQLKELVVLRASLVNDCTYCIAMHRRDALKLGESVERLDAVVDYLLGLAYRLTGVWADAEEAVVEAYARLVAAAPPDSPAAWLTTVTTRLSIDRLRARQKEAYIGPWLQDRHRPVARRDRGAARIVAPRAADAV